MFDEPVRVYAISLRPGGVIIFSLSEIANNEYGFAEKIAQLDAKGAWKALDRSRLFRTYPFLEKEAYIRHWVCVDKRALSLWRGNARCGYSDFQPDEIS